MEVLRNLPLKDLGLCMEIILCIQDGACPNIADHSWRYMVVGKLLNPFAKPKVETNSNVFDTDCIFLPLFDDSHCYAHPVLSAQDSICTFLRKTHLQLAGGSGLTTPQIKHFFEGLPDFDTERFNSFDLPSPSESDQNYLFSRFRFINRDFTDNIPF